MRSKFSLLGVLPLLTAGIASADVIVFENENPGFYLHPLENNRLDITSDAFNQPASQAPLYDGCVLSRAFNAGGSSSGERSYLEAPFGARMALADAVTYISPFSETWTAIPPMVFQPGDVVDGTQDYSSPSFGPGVGTLLHQFGPTDFQFVPNEFTIGIRFTLEGQTHYGFVSFEGFSAFNNPVRWGYESEPDTPLMIPGAIPCLADLAEPFGTLNFVDVTAFLAAFNAQDPAADLAEPFGTLNFVDITAFLSGFNAGCP